MNLYTLTGQYLELMQMAEEEQIDMDVVRDTLEGVQGEIDAEAETYAKIIRSLEGDVASLKAEIERLSTKKSVIENNITSIKKGIEAAMIATDRRKFKTPLFSFSIQKNAPSLDALDENIIPGQFWKQQEPKLDRKAALDYIKQNGDQEWGKIKQTESLRIR